MEPPKALNIFDWLNELASKSDAGIYQLFSSENAALLSRVSASLEDKDIAAVTIVQPDNFVSLTRRMRELYVVGSRDLGNTMIEAENLLNEGKHTEAREKYRAFLKQCKSEFYLNIARSQLAKISQ